MDKLKDFVLKLWTKIIEFIKESFKYKSVLPGIRVNDDDRIVKINGKSYSYADIIDCELIEDGNSVIKASLLGTAVKGMTFGIAGYLSKAKTEKKYCTKLQVKITVKNVKKPCIFMTYIKKKTKKNSKDYEKAFNNAQICLSTFKVIIDNKELK